MTTTTVDQALALARQLSIHERARLIALIAQDMASATIRPTSTLSDPWATLFSTMDMIAASPTLVGARSATTEATESRR